MLKSETLKVRDFQNNGDNKPILLRYSVGIQSNHTQPYDEDVLKLINSIKGIPDLFKSVELYYEFVDSSIRQLKRQRIQIKINEKDYYTFTSDKDLDIFLYFLRLFKDYEPEVEVSEEFIPMENLDQMFNQGVITFEMNK